MSAGGEADAGEGGERGRGAREAGWAREGVLSSWFGCEGQEGGHGAGELARERTHPVDFK